MKSENAVAIDFQENAKEKLEEELEIHKYYISISRTKIRIYYILIITFCKVEQGYQQKVLNVRQSSKLASKPIRN